MQIVGIIGRLKKGNRNSITFNEEIVKQIRKAHSIPLGILVDFEEDSTQELERILPLLKLCSGVILQGGSEYYPIDILITKYLYEHDIPTLGICLGMQTMAMSFGGIMSTIGEGHNREFPYVHDVTIDKNSKLYEIIGKDSIPVNSRHNDYIVSTTLSVCGKNSIIEAIEDKTKRFFIGVQWHPESLDDINSEKLFNAFFVSLKN